ncbi:MAG: DUF1949 domain-containing protein, partial [Clostridia bacterium]|nr:DUF1949 domain-containing protein [Clostridia bacterium]
GGGLVRAYSHAAKLAVDASGVIKMSMCVRAECECDYGYYGRLASLIPECGGTIENSDFTESVKVTFTMPQNLYGSFCAKLVDSSLGKYNATELETLFAQV